MAIAIAANNLVSMKFRAGWPTRAEVETVSPTNTGELSSPNTGDMPIARVDDGDLLIGIIGQIIGMRFRVDRRCVVTPYVLDGVGIDRDMEHFGELIGYCAVPGRGSRGTSGCESCKSEGYD